jgi:hypothetical protein
LPELLYAAGDRVLKRGERCSFPATVVAVFRNSFGDTRYVVEADVPAGLLHIASAKGLEPLPGTTMPRVTLTPPEPSFGPHPFVPGGPAPMTPLPRNAFPPVARPRVTNPMFPPPPEGA